MGWAGARDARARSVAHRQERGRRGGQPSLLRRRTYLLDSADVVVLVADARESELADTSRQLELTRAALARRASFPIPIVIQANKQDLRGALSAERFRAALGLSADIPVQGGIAREGEGVLSTFVTAAKLGMERVRRLLARDGETLSTEAPPDFADSPEALYEALVKTVEADQLEPTLGGPVHVPRPVGTVGSLGTGPAELVALLPAMGAAPAGHVWPIDTGRATLRLLEDGRLRPTRRRWLGPHDLAFDVELASGETHLLHSHQHWTFETPEHARDVLVRLVRGQQQLGDWLPEGRALTIHPDEAGRWRLWVSTGPSVPLHELIVLCAGGDPETVRSAMVALSRCAARLSSLPGGLGAAWVGAIEVQAGDEPRLLQVLDGTHEASRSEGADPSRFVQDIASLLRRSAAPPRQTGLRMASDLVFPPTLGDAVERWLSSRNEEGDEQP